MPTWKDQDMNELRDDMIRMMQVYANEIGIPLHQIMQLEQKMSAEFEWVTAND